MSGKLAVEGGPKVIEEGRLKKWPWITEDDKKAVMEMMDYGISHGDAPQTRAVEEEWAKYVGTRYCLLTNSGTAALHMAVAAAGIGPGDEVITAAYTFLASASCILHHNAIPVFVDIKPDTVTLDPAKLEEKITERTRAVIPVHMNGLPADMDEINAIARKYNLVVIEDACQSHGATYKGKKTGTLGDMAAFSQNACKNLPGGEGGFFVTDEEEYKDKAQMVRMFGEIIHKGKKRAYNSYAMGWMYRSTEFTAAFLRSQLRRLDAMNMVRTENCEYLSKRLREIKGLVVFDVPGDRTCAWWFYPVKFDPAPLSLDIPPKIFREVAEWALWEEGLTIGQWQTMPVPAQALFQNREGYGRGCPWTCAHYKGNVSYNVADYPEAQKFVDTCTWISRGFTPPNGTKELDLMVECFLKVFENIGRVCELYRKKEKR